MSTHRFGKLITYIDLEEDMGDLCLTDTHIGKVFLLTASGIRVGVWKAVGYPATNGYEDVNWELLHD